MRYTLSKKYYWSKKLAYAIGLLTTDGNLSSDLRHINLTSKDLEQINNFKNCLSLTNKIGQKKGGFNGSLSYYIQFSDVTLYDFLVRIGLQTNKSLTLKALKIPDRYFFSFLRGYLDGDGSCYSYYDKRWKNSFMVYLQFSSGSINHLIWLNNMIEKFLGFKGIIKKSNRVFNLVFAKKASIMLLKNMYKGKNFIALGRKHRKVLEVLKQAGMLESVDRHA